MHPFSLVNTPLYVNPSCLRIDPGSQTFLSALHALPTDLSPSPFAYGPIPFASPLTTDDPRSLVRSKHPFSHPSTEQDQGQAFYYHKEPEWDYWLLR